MKQLHIIGSLDPSFGGPPNSAAALMEGVQASGIEVSCLTGVWRRQDIGREKTLPVPVSRVRSARLRRRKFATLYSLAAIVWVFKNRKRFDVAHIHFSRDMFTLPIALELRALGKPYVLQTHGTCIPWKRGLVRRLVDYVGLKTAVRGATDTFVLTQAEKDELADYCNVSRVHVLENAVSETLRASSTPRRREGVVLFVGRLSPRKQVLKFVEMAAILHKELPWLRYKVLGADEGEAQAMLARIASLRLSGIVTYVGSVGAGEVRGSMLAADVLVHPADDEPFGMVLIEAMALGLPVVGNIEIPLIRRARSEGACVAVQATPDSLAAGVRGLLADDEERLALRARAEQFVDTHYRPQAIASKYLELRAFK